MFRNRTLLQKKRYLTAELAVQATILSPCRMMILPICTRCSFHQISIDCVHFVCIVLDVVELDMFQVSSAWSLRVTTPRTRDGPTASSTERKWARQFAAKNSGAAPERGKVRGATFSMRGSWLTLSGGVICALFCFEVSRTSKPRRPRLLFSLQNQSWLRPL